MQKHPLILSTGIFTLDALADPEHQTYRLFAGGSALNVLTILHSMGWGAHPIGRIGDDRAGEYFLQDIGQFGIPLDLVYQFPGDGTPVYVQQMEGVRHQFVRQCPFCGFEFVHYQPIDEPTVDSILESFPNTIEVVYIERAAPGAFYLAEQCKKKGALVFFEPNRVDHEDIFIELLQISDVFKYSNERLGWIHELSDERSVPLEIETRGAEGLRFRIGLQNQPGEWIALPALPVRNFVDAAGSGDWLSAAWIDRMAREGATGFRKEITMIVDSLQEGQKSSATNCEYASARGSLYTGKMIYTGTDFCEQCAMLPR